MKTLNNEYLLKLKCKKRKWEGEFIIKIISKEQASDMIHNDNFISVFEYNLHLSQLRMLKEIGMVVIAGKPNKHIRYVLED